MADNRDHPELAAGDAQTFSNENVDKNKLDQVNKTADNLVRERLKGFWDLPLAERRSFGDRLLFGPRNTYADEDKDGEDQEEDQTLRRIESSYQLDPEGLVNWTETYTR